MSENGVPHTILEWETKEWDMKERRMDGIRH